MQKRQIPNGQIFGELRVVEELAPTTCKQPNGRTKTLRYFLVECSCGNRVRKGMTQLVSLKITDCGCKTTEKRLNTMQTTGQYHGMTGSGLYNAWLGMKKRCKQRTKHNLEYYINRNITYDPIWENFMSFKEDMGNTFQEGLELDRVNPELGYTKENCRWVSGSMNAFNTRIQKNNKTGKTGVYPSATNGKYYATIMKENKKYVIGTFDWLIDAVFARMQAEQELFGFCKL